MKKTLNVFWIISSVFLALAALWGVITNLSDVMNKITVCGIALIIFGVICVLAAFTAGLKSAGSGWLAFDYRRPYLHYGYLAYDVGHFSDKPCKQTGQKILWQNSYDCSGLHRHSLGYDSFCPPSL